ncbi:ATP-grasp domain-containing protein [Ottowia thiooxydans]|uniref:Succinyl-CoA synthetase beta subunit n=1 Tax=Ottowia thiooxydans TaxID=219182 RepID=A0ABV2Q8K5_9BURK
MNLVEFEAKGLLRRAGLPVPPAQLLRPDDPIPMDRACVVKAQVPFGGRGKQGLVTWAAADQVQARVSEIRQRMRELKFEPVLLLEDPLEVAQETYLAWRIDDVGQCYVCSFSLHGGVEIENHADGLHELRFDPRQIPGAHDFLEFFESCGVKGRALASLSRFAASSWRAFIQNDAHLVEINPLAITRQGDVIALDAKIVLDDNADARHLDWSELHSASLTSAGLTDLEQRAQRAGLTFLELEGDTAVVSGGAGLGMALLDMLGDAGMPAANFVDTSGGSAASVYAARTQIVFERAQRDDVKAILLYLTVSASNIARHVRTLLEILDRHPPPKPMVIGILCAGAAEREMTFQQAQALFAERGFPCARDLKGVMAALVELRKKHG